MNTSRNILFITIILAIIAITFAQPPAPPGPPAPPRPHSSSGSHRQTSSSGQHRPTGSSTAGQQPLPPPSVSNSGRPTPPTPGRSSSTGSSDSDIVVGSSSGGSEEEAIAGIAKPIHGERILAFSLIGITAAAASICICVGVRRWRRNSDARRYETQHDTDSQMVHVMEAGSREASQTHGGSGAIHEGFVINDDSGEGVPPSYPSLPVATATMATVV